MTRIRLAALAAILSLVAAPAQGQLVTNGGFEAGTLAGWTLTGSVCVSSAQASAANSGNYGYRTGPIGGTCTLSQTIATTAGAQYDFSFWLRNGSPGTPNSFDARWDGVSVYSLSNAASFSYTQQFFSVTATGASTTIAFVTRHDPNFYYVDDVAVVAASTTVPEPSTYALMAAGLMGIAVARRRRRA